MSHASATVGRSLGKLSPPRLGRVIGRERLFARMEQYAAAPGMWIAGPPGIGKTTLVATYVEARALPCLWLQLDAGDADPATFVHFLRAAAARHVPQRRLRLPLPSTDDLRDVPGFTRRCFRRLALSLDPPWVLVLDNLQELGPEALLHSGIAAALAELPGQTRLIAISREPPGPAYARALASQQLALIEAAALRFNDLETRQLVRLHDRDWQASALRHATDGWAAAMILLLAARSELDPDAAMHGGAARDRLFDFFAGEVMQAMAPPDALALMRIAFLPSATAAMATSISGDPHAADLLADLARRSLFTDRRAGPPPAYTFHALFSAFLRARAADRLDAEALRSLRVQAAQILVEHGQADAAMAQLIEAAAWDEALTLLVAQAGRFVAQGRTATVRGWILALPEAVRGGAQASYWLGYCALASEPADALRHLERAHAGFTAAADALGSFCTAAAAADAIIFLGTNLDALAPWMPLLESYAPVYLASRDVESDLRVLPGLLAAFVHRETAHPLTAPLADLAECMLDQPLAASQRILLGSLAYYLLWTGQTVRLDRIMIKIDRMCAGQDVAPATLFRWYGVGVLIRSLLGRIDEASDYARRALALASPGPAPMRAKAHLLMVLAALAARNSELARTHLHEAASVLDADNPIDVTTYEFQRGLLMMLDGDWRGAAQLMRAAVASGHTSGWPLREHIALLGQALACTQVGAFADAEGALRAVLLHRFHAVCRWHQWLAALIEAYLAERQDDRPRCLAALEQAFAIGRACGYDFGPMPYCCDDMMPRLASLALDHGIDRPFALQIVRRYALPAPKGAGEHWPWPIRIRTLGHFSVERDGEPAKSSRKESRKPLDLLKILMSLGGEAVPVTRLCAALWPEAPGDAARNSFDNALHRLRKLLGGDQRVQLHSGGLSLDAATCWTDVTALTSCLTQLDRLASDCDPASRLALLELALTLYQGEYLAGEDELPDVLVTRQRLQTWFSRQVAAQGAWLEAEGQFDAAVRLYRRVIEQQPLAEAIYRRLIRCLLELGQRAEAYEVYRRCRQQLSIVLGIRTAPETDALVAALRNL
ncbi:BTAD domain-containing putative transcriptional regulator [Rhodoferax sp.]|uniref:BTAD domain-containing putative transcriptional regulator n=1 Tax=Rhodoferax sp. TaxID=50421 RepID=UPI0027199C69|nr:BTAD domain-containing putative transcriptional regulator [Rhodoferax sp.]MDO9195954.1 BTAD domain-containing putative transcriptional regulator [Rhodoferax sp.]